MPAPQLVAARPRPDAARHGLIGTGAGIGTFQYINPRRQRLGTQNPASVLDRDVEPAERIGQWLADEDAFAGHGHALPVCLEQGLALQIPEDRQRRIGKFARMIAGLDHRAVTAGGAGLEPAQAAHLRTVDELAAGRGEMIGDRARHEAQRVETGHLRHASEIEQHVFFIFDCVLLHDFEIDPFGRTLDDGGVNRRAHIARLVAGAVLVAGAARMGNVGRDAAVDQRLHLLEIPAGQRHGRPQAVIAVRRGAGYLLSTGDKARNVRAAIYPAIVKRAAEWVDLEIVQQDAIENKKDVLFYFTGMAQVPGLDTLRFVPGAIADHLTSAGGQLIDSSQMSSLRWLEAGATGSCGAVVARCNPPGKFPNPALAIFWYLQGETFIEAYWKSVAMPGEGIFIGEPLANPFGGYDVTVEDAGVNLRTQVLPAGSYVLEGADSGAGPYLAVPGRIVVRPGRNELRLGHLDKALYRLVRVQ